MPLYDYTCRTCSHSFIERQGFHDAREAVCPQCGGPAAQRFSMPGVVFKGSGFYVNDYGGKKTGAPTRDGEREEEGGSEPSEGQSDGASDSASDSDGGHGHKHPHTDLDLSHSHSD